MTKLAEELEALLDDYWELAYDEGRSKLSNGDKANEVLFKIRRAIEAECRKAEPVAQVAEAYTRGRADGWEAAELRYKPVAQKPVAWSIWICGEVAGVFRNKDEAVLAFKHRQEKYPDSSRKLVPLYTAPPAPETGDERANGNAVLVPCDKLAQMKDRIAELEATIEAQRTLYANCIKISHEADELEHKCHRLERQQKVLVEAMEKLARLGNGEHYGNSECNCIAIAALASVKGNAEVTGVTTGENDAT